MRKKVHISGGEKEFISGEKKKEEKTLKHSIGL